MHDLELRAIDGGLRADGGATLAGWAVRTGVLSENLGGFKEVVLPAALERALGREPDLVALFDHDSQRVLGRVSAKTLRVSQDELGLRFEVDLPAHEAGLAESVGRGDIRGASFSFRTLPNGDAWDEQTSPPTRTLRDIEIREISIVTFPAFVQTSVALRSLEHHRMKETITVSTPTAPVADPVPPIVLPALDPHLESETRGFSLRALIAGAAGLPGAEWGRERELSQEVARRAGRTFEGYAVPASVFEQRIVTTALPAGGPGSNVIATDYRGDQYIDRLRAALVVRRLGATVLTGLVGNVAIPRLKASATSGWIAENAALTASDVQFEQVTLQPKHVGALTEYSRNMLLQSSPDIEELLRSDFAALLARAVDAAAIRGGGTNEPVGILSTAGIGSVALGTNGGAPTWAGVIGLTAAVEQADATGGGFLTNYKATAKMKTTVKAVTTDSMMIMEARDSLADYPLVATSLVPSTLVKGTSGSVCSALIFGNFADCLVGYWSELDILVNPYESTAYTKGNVQIRGFITMDVKLRHAESFAAIQDMTTT